MYRSLGRPTLAFAPDEPVAGGAHDPVQPVDPAPVTQVEPTPAPPAGESVAEPAPPATPVVDWAQRIEEWGGEDEVKAAVALRNTLRTREGVVELMYDAARALGLPLSEVERLLTGGRPAAPAGVDVDQEPTIEELLADPERVLTAGEVAKLLEHRERQRQAQAQAELALERIRTTIASTLDELKVADEQDRQIILALADGMLGEEAGPNTDPAKIKSAIVRAHAAFQQKVSQQAQQWVTEKHEVHSNLPGPMPAGSGPGGGEPLPEPQNVEEAKRRAREQLRHLLSASS
jgi:hypothetical protein